MISLKGDKIFLRAVETTDATKLMLWENDPKHWKVTGTEVPYSLHAILEYIEQAQNIRTHGQLRMMICLNENKEAIGTVDLYNVDFKHEHAAIGILLGSEEYRRMGFASEAIRMSEMYARQFLGLYNLHCSIQGDNLASQLLFESLEFERVGVRKNWYNINGHRLDEIMYVKCLKRD